jgi:hypothetical protein
MKKFFKTVWEIIQEVQSARAEAVLKGRYWV